MKKTAGKSIRRTSDGMRTDYDLRNGVRGKYADQFAARANVIVLSPDLAAAFPNSKSVNAALRRLLKLTNRKTG